jgi:hypothetical protein
MTVDVNPFDGYADEDLFSSLLSLHLACARTKSVLKEKHRVTLCNLIGVLVTESNNRGKSVPQWPYSA